MVNRVSQMEELRSTTSVYFLRFTKVFSSNPNVMICAFEGDDEQYYCVRLDLLAIGLQWRAIPCDGKKNVLDLHSIISSNESYKKAMVAYFVDRDFDDPLPPDTRTDIYETPCYSVENFYCTEHSINRILSAEFKLTRDPDRDILVNVAQHFKKLQTEFHQTIRHVNAWIKAHRRKDLLADGQGNFKKLNLNNVHIDQFITVSSDSVSEKQDISGLSVLFPNCRTLTDDEIRQADESLSVGDPGCDFRGKYELEFVRLYLNNLRFLCTSDSTSDFYNPRCTIRLPLSTNNTLSELSQYASTPPCLEEFIRRLKRRYDERQIEISGIQA